MRPMSRLIPPADGRKIWKLRLKPPGFDYEATLSTRSGKKASAERFKARIDRLVEARANGDPAPVELTAWIEGLHSTTAKRLIELRLLDRARFEQAKPLRHTPIAPEIVLPDGSRKIETDHIDDWEREVAARQGNTPAYARAMAWNVRRIIRDLKVDYFPQLNRHDVQVLVGGWDLAPNTKRKYLMAVRDFASWMKRDKRTQVDPFAEMPIPPQLKSGVIKRRAMTVAEFRYLCLFLDKLQLKGGRYEHQKAAWTALDRKMIYWTAVATAYRQGELDSLRRYQLYLAESPAMIDIHAADAKNRTAGSVPIPSELAEALIDYCAALHPAAKVFSFPGDPHNVMAFFRRDLAEARAAWLAEETLAPAELDRRRKSEFLDADAASGRLDFHALRHTAITWWLTENNLPPKAVQQLARLETLALVENYSRAFKIQNFGWLEHSPSISQTPGHRKLSGA